MYIKNNLYYVYKTITRAFDLNKKYFINYKIF